MPAERLPAAFVFLLCPCVALAGGKKAPPLPQETAVPVEETAPEAPPAAPAAVSVEAAPEIPPAEVKVHKVWIWQETSDCLWNIAKENYGDPFLWPKIYEANRNLIKDPNVIFPKQRIVIPPLEEGR